MLPWVMHQAAPILLLLLTLAIPVAPVVVGIAGHYVGKAVHPRDPSFFVFVGIIAGVVISWKSISCIHWIVCEIAG